MPTNEEALAACEARSDSLEAARILANTAAIKGAVGDAKASLACAERAVSLARDTTAAGRRRVLALALMNLAAALLRVGDPDGALVASAEAVAVADGFGEPLMRRMARGILVDAHFRRGELETAVALHRQALGIGPVDALRQLEGLARMAVLLIASASSERGIRLAGAVEANSERLDYARMFSTFPFAETLEKALRALVPPAKIRNPPTS